MSWLLVRLCSWVYACRAHEQTHNRHFKVRMGRIYSAEMHRMGLRGT
jgi:hypothetical protein